MQKKFVKTEENYQSRMLRLEKVFNNLNLKTIKKLENLQNPSRENNIKREKNY